MHLMMGAESCLAIGVVECVIFGRVIFIYPCQSDMCEIGAGTMCWVASPNIKIAIFMETLLF